METIPISTSAGIFSIVTIVYGLCKYFIASSSYPNNTNISNVIYGFYVVIAIFIQLTININNSKALCSGKSPQIIGTIIHTFLPNLLIFVVVGICIRMFPGWLQPFSNTVGYCILSISQNLEWLSDIATQGNDKTLIKKDNSLFLNELTPTNFTSLITKMIKAKLINFDETLEENNDGAPPVYKVKVGGRKQKGGAKYDSTDDVKSAVQLEEQVFPTKSSGKESAKKIVEKLPKEIQDNKKKSKFQDLWKLVNIKNTISEVIWFLLCGVLVLAYSYNAILNLSCSHSLEQQEQLNKESDEKLEKVMKDIDDS